jgi:dTDP-glucose 4,6-dehydratase
MSDLILVTGSAGFIGSNLCHLLQEQGRDFIHLDGVFPEADLSNLDGVRVPLIRCDLAIEREVVSVFDSYPITQVIHLAANSHVDRSIYGDLPFWRSNVLGTSNLMRAALSHKMRIRSIINQITDEFYGEIPRDHAPAVEGQAPHPTSPYPCSKTGQYFVGRSFLVTYGLPVISTFPVNAYGPRQNVEKLIPKFATNLLRGEKVPLMASSHFERDWIPVVDMCRAFLLLLDKGRLGEDYNIGADRHHTNLEITKKLLKITGRDESYIKTVPDRQAHDCRYAVDSAKIKSLGFTLQNDFDEYLEHTVAWFRAHV